MRARTELRVSPAPASNCAYRCGSSDTVNHHHEPLDGSIVFLCDKLAAYLEADLSIKHGIESRVLTEARTKIRKKFKQAAVGGVSFGYLFEYDYSG